jgi:hypothetical protein
MVMAGCFVSRKRSFYGAETTRFQHRLKTRFGAELVIVCKAPLKSTNEISSADAES